jgi:hypothetical protein
MRSYADRPQTDRRVPVPEAATILGISPEAVRQRLKRGTLDKEKGADGAVYVILDADRDRHNGDGTADITTDLSLMQAHLDSMRDEIGHLRRQLDAWQEEARRKDHIIAGLVERLPPQLEAPATPASRDAPQTTAEDAGGVEDPFAEEPRPERSWWRRWFGFG